MGLAETRVDDPLQVETGRATIGSPGKKWHTKEILVSYSWSTWSWISWREMREELWKTSFIWLVKWKGGTGNTGIAWYRDPRIGNPVIISTRCLCIQILVLMDGCWWVHPCPLWFLWVYTCISSSPWGRGWWRIANLLNFVKPSYGTTLFKWSSAFIWSTR